MTLDAFETSRRWLVVLVQFLTEYVLMATGRGTGGIDRHVRFETSQRRCFRDVDMADGALGRWDGMALSLATALVPKLH